MSSDNPNVIARNADGSPLQSSFVSIVNSSVAVPTVASPFVGLIELIIDFVGITITLATEQSMLHTGNLIFEFSMDDGVHWDISVPVYYTSANPFVPFPLRKVQPWFRVRYVPDDDNLTAFRLQTIYHRLAPETITRLLSQDIILSEPVKVMRAGLMAVNDAGTAMTNLRTGANGLHVDPTLSGVSLEATQQALLTNLETLNSLVPSKFDNIQLAYTQTDLTQVQYFLGATLVSTLTLGYVSGNLVSVTKT